MARYTSYQGNDLNNGAMVSGVVNYDVNLDAAKTVGVQFNTTQVSAGTFKAQAGILESIDGVNFTPVASGVLTGNTTAIYSIVDPTYKYARVNVNTLSGSGIVNAYCYLKGFVG